MASNMLRLSPTSSAMDSGCFIHFGEGDSPSSRAPGREVPPKRKLRYVGPTCTVRRVVNGELPASSNPDSKARLNKSFIQPRQQSENEPAMLLQETQIQTDQRKRSRGAMGDAVPLTPAARHALELERAELRDEKQREIPARLRVAREFGDPSNNDEYLAIREEEAVLDARILRLEDILMRATMIDPASAHDSVAVGSEVEVVDVDKGEERTYVIESAHGPVGRMRVSPNSPVGRALLGRRAGDRIAVELPAGGRRELELRAVRAPQGT